MTARRAVPSKPPTPHGKCGAAVFRSGLWRRHYRRARPLASMSVAILVAAVRVSAATASGRRDGRSSRGRTPAAVDGTLPANCRSTELLTIGRIGPRQRRDANANGRSTDGQDQDGGGLFHALVSNRMVV
jgi:hypothetical protein